MLRPCVLGKLHPRRGPAFSGDYTCDAATRDEGKSSRPGKNDNPNLRHKLSEPRLSQNTPQSRAPKRDQDTKMARQRVRRATVWKLVSHGDCDLFAPFAYRARKAMTAIATSANGEDRVPALALPPAGQPGRLFFW